MVCVVVVVVVVVGGQLVLHEAVEARVLLEEVRVAVRQHAAGEGAHRHVFGVKWLLLLLLDDVSFLMWSWMIAELDERLVSVRVAEHQRVQAVRHERLDAAMLKL